MDHVDFDIVNWEKYNPKRDQQTYTWLRLDNGLATDPDLFGLDAEQKFVWVVILCQASKKNSGTLSLSLGWLEHATGVKKAKIEALFDFLESKQSIRQHDRARPPVVVDTTPTYVRTNETYERDERTIATGSRPIAEATIGPAIWEAYRSAYRERYGEDPVRNAKVNSQIKQFMTRVPAGEGPAIAAFYVQHNHGLYVGKMHPVGLLLQDAEKLRTEWATGRMMTGTQARQVEKASHAQDQLARIARGEL